MTITILTSWMQFAAELLILAGVIYNTAQTCFTNRKISKVHADVKLVEATTIDTNKRVEAVETSSNGMREALVTLTEKEAFARGAAEGATAERERQEQKSSER